MILTKSTELPSHGIPSNSLKSQLLKNIQKQTILKISDLVAGIIKESRFIQSSAQLQRQWKILWATLSGWLATTKPPQHRIQLTFFFKIVFCNVVPFLSTKDYRNSKGISRVDRLTHRLTDRMNNVQVRISITIQSIQWTLGDKKY